MQREEGLAVREGNKMQIGSNQKDELDESVSKRTNAVGSIGGGEGDGRGQGVCVTRWVEVETKAGRNIITPPHVYSYFYLCGNFHRHNT